MRKGFDEGFENGDFSPYMGHYLRIRENLAPGFGLDTCAILNLIQFMYAL